MNKLIVIGNLTRDPEIRYSKGKDNHDLAVAHFTIAVNDRMDDSTDYFNCAAFGKRAEFIEKYFTKGSRIVVSGKMKNNNYINKNGEKVYAFQVLAEEVEFGSTGKGSDSTDNKKENTNPLPSDEFLPAQEAELPF